MLEGSAIEAIAKRDPRQEVSTLDAQAVKTFLTKVESGKPASEAVTARVFVVGHEAGQQFLFGTCDRAQGNVVIHRNFLAG